MNILISYSTKNGCTEKCSIKLAEYLKVHTVHLHKLGSKEGIRINDHDAVIIGGSIRIGQINKEVKRYCQKNLEELIQKRIGLFICCMNGFELATEYFRNAFPDELQKHAIAKGYFGGELNFEEMSFIERSIMKEIINIDKNVSIINEDNIVEFARTISGYK